MLTLVTSNPAKYLPFAQLLEQMRVGLVAPTADVPEIQALSFNEALGYKARSMAQVFGRPVLVDDAGLILDSYRPFPGPLTSVVLRSLGQAGLQRLLSGASHQASMECHLGWWNHDRLRTWSGAVNGRIDFSRKATNPRMLLTDLFVPESDAAPETFPHRARALAALHEQAFELHLETTAEPAIDQFTCPAQPSHQCPFCIELEGTGQSIFSEMIRDRLPSRVLYEDDDFIVMPPLGQFMEGGLLLLSRQHILSCAYLPKEKFARLEQLLTVIRREVSAIWGVPPLVFEHGPAADRSKGVCCVDHAHFNIFPARVPVFPHLFQRMSLRLDAIEQLARLRSAEFGYLFVQENDGTMRVYDGHMVPTQLVSRIITTQLGLSQRWHWKDYPGCDELVRTYAALKGRIRL